MTFREKRVSNLKMIQIANSKIRSHKRLETQTFTLGLIARSYETKFKTFVLRQNLPHKRVQITKTHEKC